jgi:hypothetical protein
MSDGFVLAMPSDYGTERDNRHPIAEHDDHIYERFADADTQR